MAAKYFAMGDRRHFSSTQNCRVPLINTNATKNPNKGSQNGSKTTLKSREDCQQLKNDLTILVSSKLIFNHRVGTVRPLSYLPRQTRVTVKNTYKFRSKKTLFTTLFNTKARMTTNIARFHTTFWLTDKLAENSIFVAHENQRSA